MGRWNSMKRMNLFLSLLICLLFFSLSGCGGNQPADIQAYMDIQEAAATGEEAKDEISIPQIGRVKSICELATLECRYHNVAKATKEAGEGVLHWGEKERTFWIAYTGIAEIRFQTRDIRMKQEGTNITVQLPKPYVLCRVDSDSWTKDSYVLSEDQWIQKNPITADDQTQAIQAAQAAIEEKIRNHSSLLNTAELQAKELIENYIIQIGEAAGITYTITFEDSQTSKQN